jgi:hypothetical protein
MEHVNKKWFLESAMRMNFLPSAKAAEVLLETKKILEQTIEEKIKWRLKYWKKGILWIAVKHPVEAQKIFFQSEYILEHLRKVFPKYQFRGIKVQIVETL